MSDITDTLDSILESSPRSGSFCASHTSPIKDLAIQIKDFGPLKLPLSANKAKTLISCAKPAKFGWRDQTLHDKTVRDVWEINKNNLKIDKRLWNNTLHPALDKIKCELGLPDNARLKADLHNLLIYAPGQFFKPHQDSEKLDGMLATLLVVLPSKHSGGNLVVNHQGEKKQFQSSRYGADKLAFFAFYADCHHEVKPIKSGYRVVLSYNLVLDNQSHSLDAEMDASALQHALSEYFAGQAHQDEQPSYWKKSPKKMVYLLDHHYTQKSLSWQQLKNVDRLRADAFIQSAQALDLDIHLALVDIQETWQCEDNYDADDDDDYDYDEDDEDEDDEDEGEDSDDDDNESEHELIELLESEISVRHWLDVNANQLNYKDLLLSDRYIHWTKEMDEFKPFESEYEGWMGNYGSTLDRWYHRAAIILWRKQDHFSVLLEMDFEGLMSQMLALANKKTKLSELQHIAKAVTLYWADYLPHDLTPNLQKNILTVALALEHPQYAKKIAQEFDLDILQVKMIPMITNLSDRYGIDWCISLFKSWSANESDYEYDPSLCKKIDELLASLTLAGKQYAELCHWLINYQFATIKKYAKEINDRVPQIITLLLGCSTVGDDQTYTKLIEEMIANKKLYPAFKLIPVVDSFFSIDSNRQRQQIKARKTLCVYIKETLQAEYELGLREPTDWCIKENMGCRCKDCITLTKYLRSATQIKLVWPMGQGRRKHIHGKIDSLGLAVSHTTLHEGSPHKLILKKTRDLYKSAKKRYGIIGDALDKLQQY